MNAPVLAVVGFVNMGKSSLVATLSETDVVAIDATAGTTTRCQRFECVADGQRLFELIDTPGFQSARRALRWLEDWLEERGEESVTGPDAIAAFLEGNQGSATFSNEIELLRPIVDGAGILYLVDASMPYKARYEAEMRILAMSGRPRMGIINLHGAAEHQQAWHDALSANFAKVVALDVLNASREERQRVLQSFAGIDDDWAPAFEQATAVLDDEDRHRRRRIAGLLRELLLNVLSARERSKMPDIQQRNKREQDLRDKLKHRINHLEQDCRRAVEHQLGFQQLERREDELAILDDDLFSKEVWRLFGLSRRKLIATAVASGAGIGGLLDLGVGGLSFGTGALIGGAVGLVSSLAAIQGSFNVSVLGQDLIGEGAQLQVEAPRHLKWASIVADRALIHYRLLRMRTHARRDALTVSGVSVMDQLDKNMLTRFALLVKDSDAEHLGDEDLQRQWQQWLLQALDVAEAQ